MTLKLDKVDVLQEDIEKALKRPDNFGYSGPLPLFATWGLVGPSKSRDSKCLERANFDAITEEVTNEYPERAKIVRSSHWVVGWVEQLAVRVIDDNGNPTDVFTHVISVRNALSDYPVYDEQLYREYQREEALDVLEACFIPSSVDVDTSEVLRHLYEQYNIHEDQFCRGHHLPDDIEEMVASVAYDLHFGGRDYHGMDVVSAIEHNPDMIDHANTLNKLHDIEEAINNDQRFKPVQTVEQFLGAKRTETLNQLEQFQ